MRLQLHLGLKSDATFGRGEGVAGLVDEEVEHDTETGLPFVRGRSVKGALVEECAGMLYALGRQDPASTARLDKAAQFLFGRPGSTLDDDAHMHVGPGLLPATLRAAVEAEVKSERVRLRAADVLESLTAIRRQTAVDEATGGPEEHSLRSLRVVLRETPFAAHLDFDADPNADALALLAACVMGLRRLGTGTSRGRGRITCRLLDERGTDITAGHFAHFQHVVRGIA